MKKNYGRRLLLLCVVFILCLWGQDADAADKGSQLRERLLQGYQNYARTVDVRSIGLSVDSPGDQKIINQVMEDVLNETTYLFYAGRGFSVSVDTSTGRLVQMKLTYDKRYLNGSNVNVSKIKKVQGQLNRQIDSIMKAVKPGMSDVEKALVLHDYLVRTVTYTDKSAAAYRISEEGALLKRKANCMGYALAYVALLERAGIEARCVSSESMVHMWNLVKIGGKWYHVDLVWDAPLSVLNEKNMYGYVCHDNFLVSNAAIRKTGHKGFSAPAADTRYDKKYWRNVDSGFWYQDGKYYYADTRGIHVRRRIDGGSSKRLKKGGAACFVKNKGNKYCYISNNRIYRFDIKSRKRKAVYKPPVGARLVQLKCSKKKIYFRYVKGKKVITKSKKI